MWVWVRVRDRGIGEGAEVALTGGRGLTWLGGEVLVKGSRCRGRGLSPRTRHAAAAACGNGTHFQCANAWGTYTGILDFPPVLLRPGFLGIGDLVGGAGARG